MSVAYGFPLLSSNELIDTMKTLQIPVSLNDLKNPTDKTVDAILEHFVEPLMGVSKDDLRQPSLQGLDFLKFYPELHEEAFPKLMKSRVLLQMMWTVCMRDFSLRDLVNPTPARVRIMLSAITNFLLFREQKMEMYQKAAAEQEELQQSRNTLEEQNSQALLVLQKIQAERESEAPAIQQLEAENAELGVELEQQYQQHAALKTEIGKLKKEIEVYKERNEVATSTLEAIKADCEQLRSQIIQSPLRLKANLKEMSATAASEKEEIKELKLKLRQMGHKKEQLEKLTVDFQEKLQMLEECEDCMDRAQRLRKEVRDNQSQVSSSEQQIVEFKETEQHLKKRIAMLQEKIYELQNAHEQQKHHQKLEIEKVQAEKFQAMHKSADREKIEYNQNLVNQRQRALEQRRDEHKAAINKMTLKYQEILDRLLSYHSKMEEAFG